MPAYRLLGGKKHLTKVMNIRILGILMMIGSGVIIINSKHNYNMLESNPYQYTVSGGIWSSAYSFAPPFTTFEIVVMLAGALGLYLALKSNPKP
jgi:hypothetical protein